MTAGRVIFGEALIPPHTAGPSLHVHTREDEAAYVVEGVHSCRVGEDRFDAAAGSLVWLPREVPHTFANLSDSPVRVLGVTVPAGLEGMFQEQGSHFAQLTGPPDEEVIAAIGKKYGVTVVGPPLEVGDDWALVAATTWAAGRCPNDGSSPAIAAAGPNRTGEQDARFTTGEAGPK